MFSLAAKKRKISCYHYCSLSSTTRIGSSVRPFLTTLLVRSSSLRSLFACQKIVHPLSQALSLIWMLGLIFVCACHIGVLAFAPWTSKSHKQILLVMLTDCEELVVGRVLACIRTLCTLKIPLYDRHLLLGFAAGAAPILLHPSPLLRHRVCEVGTQNKSLFHVLFKLWFVDCF